MAAGLPTGKPMTKAVSHASLMKIARDDLRSFAPHFCGIDFPPPFTKAQIVDYLLIHQALRGTGASGLGQLVAQVSGPPLNLGSQLKIRGFNSTVSFAFCELKLGDQLKFALGKGVP